LHLRAEWTDVPLELQLLILADTPLAELARLATLCKPLRAVYRERLRERQACIEGRLAEGWPKDVTKEFSPEDMALPHDLIDSPPVGHL
jgi:hypothetical protein